MRLKSMTSGGMSHSQGSERWPRSSECLVSANQQSPVMEVKRARVCPPRMVQAVIVRRGFGAGVIAVGLLLNL